MVTRGLPPARSPLPARSHRDPRRAAVAGGLRAGRRLGGRRGLRGVRVRLQDLVDGLAQHPGRVLERRAAPSARARARPAAATPPQPTTVGTDRHTSRTPYSPAAACRPAAPAGWSRATAWTTSRIDRPTAKPAPPLSLMTSAPAALVRSKTCLGASRRSSRATAPAAARRPARSTRSAPCCRRARRGSSALTCVGGHLQRLGDQAAEAGRVELRAQAEHLRCQGRPEPLHGQVRQHVDRVADDDEVRSRRPSARPP